MTDRPTPETDALIARQDAEYANKSTPEMDYKQRRQLIAHARAMEQQRDEHLAARGQIGGLKARIAELNAELDRHARAGKVEPTSADSDVPAAIFGSFPDLPDCDCEDPFTAVGKRVLAVRERFSHLDGVLRGCSTSDPIYKVAAELWEAIAGPVDNASASHARAGKGER
jgi:hypothetical protein